MSRDFNTISEMIEAAGGPAAFGRAIGVSTEHASVMKKRKSIPITYWDALLKSEFGQEAALSAEYLLELHAPNQSSASTHGEAA